MSKIIKTGLLSFGLSGKVFHAPFVNEHKGFELTAVVERSKKVIKDLYPTVISYNNIDEILADSNIDLIIVNTPNNTHYNFAVKALQAKKHVLMEKPFAITSKEAKELYNIAVENNCSILAYQNRRFDSDYLSVKKVLESGDLGDVVEAHIRFDRYKTEIGPKVAKETASIPGSGITYDLGSHIVDAAISLFGNPISWHKKKGYYRENTQVDDFMSASIEFPNNVHVQVTTSMLVPNPQPAFVIHGTKGTYVKQRINLQEEQLMQGMQITDENYGIEPKGNEGTLTIAVNAMEKKIVKITSEPATYMHIFEAVYQTIINGKQYPITKAQIIKQLEILED
ncbi:oxidoreductase [Wenyingzhuangia fucanilytica]|uniref:Oxidoreductase n=1 Tax=Wenyingzhuangia fucanilytica TaxID=1790137 RepID=A0A1B1Y498_9FLAO|nr:Gfo/Idh/MocA family oxidoreductase [Wenyingzhuangia fucanilytica]ANW95592.1 oxidoreductase [Wenyingzhuangia fucanilytica]